MIWDLRLAKIGRLTCVFCHKTAKQKRKANTSTYFQLNTCGNVQQTKTPVVCCSNESTVFCFHKKLQQHCCKSLALCQTIKWRRGKLEVLVQC